MFSMDPICQFLVSARMFRLLVLPEPNKLEDAICGKPAQWQLMIRDDIDSIWVCSEHYDVLIDQGWSEL